MSLEIILFSGGAVEKKVSIGKRCKIEADAYICAFSTIEDYCFVARMVAPPMINFWEELKKGLNTMPGRILKGGHVSGLMPLSYQGV